MSDTLADITTRGWILALFIRDDGERFLLGDGAYDFKDSVQHFQPNTFANDVIELQGTDGQLIAGQVRRSATQTFDGWIGDATKNRQTIEQYRRDFLMFFRKNFFYKVIYIFPNGEAIQRKRGYIVDAPSVPELYQIFPAYHIGLNFEDPDYYEYAEDIDGEEIFANIREILIAQALSGGLIWDAIGAVSNAITWTTTATTSGEYIQIDNTAGLPAPITDLEIKGKTEQGKLPAGYTQLDYIENTDTSLMTYINTGVQLGTSDFEISAGVRFTATATYESPVLSIWTSTYGYWNLFKTGGNIDCYTQAHHTINSGATVGTWFDYKLTRSGSNWALEDGVHTGITWTYTPSATNNTNLIINARGDLSTGYKTSARYSYVKIKVAGILVRDYVPARRSSDNKIGLYDIINDTFVSSAGTNEFTAGATVPNPNTPQDIYNVSGENTIHICGKNLFDKNAITSGKILGRDDGTLATQASYGVTDFIEVKPGEKYTFTGFNYWYSCYYDENQTYIDHPTNTATITIPNGVRYIRSSLLLTNLDTAQFERGETASSYEAYQGRDYPLIIDSFDLSDGYVKLEYIQTPTDAFTSNPLYVELTDIWGTTNWKMEFDFAIASNYNYNCIFGRTDAEDTTKEIWVDGSATYKYRAFGIAVVGTNEVIGESVSIGKRYRISHDNLGDKFTVITNGTQTYQYNGKLPATSSAGQTYAFGWRKGGGQFRGKIYGIKTWDGNGLVDDLVPAMRKSDNAIGFYNRVDKSFRTMQGAGASTATAGPRSDFLGKIDDSQDKIYTDGADWYVRKEIDKITFYGASAENWTAGTLTSLRYVVGINVDGKKYSASNSIYGLKSDRNLPNKSSEADALEQNDYTFRGTTYGNRLWYFLPKSEFVGLTAAEIVTEWKTMLATNPATVYYALETPTDTKITNADLIAQLDALKKTKLFQGQNNLATITLNSIPTLELEYGTAYDADGSGYEWEDGGGDGSTIISVAGVDNVQPIWEVKGPATDPTLTNITTGQTITWQSTVPAGQTLTIDMDARTATMAGANVFQFVSGDWIDLQPGNNKMSYTATNGATEPSTLSWNGVVG